MKGLLVADSGGTGTDWSYTDISGSTIFFSTGSYHPSRWLGDFIETERLFWDNYPEMKLAELKFYGAGCLNERNAEQMKSFFIGWGFENVSVFSDIHAAGLASFGMNNGIVAILGTGSVLAEMDQGEIISLKGGLGYLLGDEGSGFYFGKLVIQSLLGGELTDSVASIINKSLGDRSIILQKVYGENGKSFLASLSKELTTISNEEIEKLHEKNIQLFIDTLKLSLDQRSKPIYFCGSYAFHRETNVRSMLKKNSLIPGGFQEKPIGKLTEYILRDTF